MPCRCWGYVSYCNSHMSERLLPSTRPKTHLNLIARQIPTHILRETNQITAKVDDSARHHRCCICVAAMRCKLNGAKTIHETIDTASSRWSVDTQSFAAGSMAVDGLENTPPSRYSSSRLNWLHSHRGLDPGVCGRD